MVVYGLGVSGRAAIDLLESRGVSIVAVDRRPQLESGEAPSRYAELILGQEDPGLPEGVDAVILSPGVSADRRLVREARQAGLPVLSEVELAFPFLEGSVVAVTGSNGKSTTVSMTSAMLEAAGIPVELCGNIGEPLCSKVEGPAGRVFVVELSSFQLEAVVLFHADSAALLNLSPDHLDRYDDFDDYVSAKGHIFDRQGPESIAILNADDGEVCRLAAGIEEPRQRFFSRSSKVADGCHALESEILEVAPGEEPRTLFRRSDLRVAGLHNLENAMAAALLARSCGISCEDIRKGLRAFEGLPHRLQEVRDRGGVRWYDDSKGTNVGATEKSLEGFADSSVHLILGGRGKGTDPAALLNSVRRKARHLYFIGEAAGLFEEALGGEVDSDNVGTLEVAIERAAEEADPGEVVLLSPACASFDQFESFEDRGRRFQELVMALNGEDSGEETGL